MRGDGWIPLHRQVYDPDHWLAPTKKHPAGKREAWLDICQLAQHRPREYAGERLRRGEVILSVRGCAKRWCWSTGRVQRFMERLRSETDTMLEAVRDTLHGTVYRVVNYEAYAHARDTERYAERDGDRNGSDTPPIQEQQGTRDFSSPSEAPQEFVAWMGDNASALDGLSRIETLSLWGLYGPHGTDQRVWGRVPDGERPALLATVLLRWRAEEHKRLEGRLVRRIIQTVIKEGSHEHGTRGTDGRRARRGRAPEAPRDSGTPPGQGEFQIG